MRIESLWVVALMMACGSSPDAPGGAAGAAGSSSGASGGDATQGGSAAPTDGGARAGGGASAGAESGGASAAGAGAGAGGASGGRPAGGAGAAAGSGTGGASAGAGGASGGAGTPAGGSGGACVENLACKLDPPPSTGDLQQDCVNRINQFLTQCACLPALKRRMDGEACANQMAKYDADHNEAHAGIRAKICEPGGSQNSCPGYSSNAQVVGLCLQQMWDEGPPPTPDCTGDCYQEYGHFINMTDPDVKQVACGFHTTAAGKVWAVQNFTR